MTAALLDKLERRWPRDRWRGLTIVVGCSGGADSTALLLAARQLRPVDSTLIVAHFNHRLRGDESDADQRFAEALADEAGCLFVTNRLLSEAGQAAADQPSPIISRRDEASLREVRYRFLRQVAAQHGARYVAVAHTADDSVETTLHNLVRGTGLSGLTGIAPFRDLDSDLVLIRPLIDVWRSEVIEFLAANRQPYRHDSSNTSAGYTRNRIRHRWLPMLEEDFGKEVRAAVHRSSAILSELQLWLQSEAIKWLDQRLVRRTPGCVELLATHAVGVEWPVVQHALTILWQQQSWPLVDMTHGHWNQIRSLFQSPMANDSAVELPSRIRVSQTGQRWLIEKRKAS